VERRSVNKDYPPKAGPPGGGKDCKITRLRIKTSKTRFYYINLHNLSILGSQGHNLQSFVLFCYNQLILLLTSHMKINKTTAYHLSFIMLVFLAQFLFINPIGEFALNDDWVHTEIAKHLVDTGEFRMSPYAGPTFYIPILYGAALIKIFGFSFSMLRISTLILSLFSILIFYFLLNKTNNKPHINLLITLALWLNPIFYNLSFTFMTDIPALFLFIASIFLYYIGFEKKNAWYLFFGSLVSVVGFYTRQTNILPMVAAGLYVILNPDVIWMKNLSYHKIPLTHLVLSFGVPSLLWLSMYIFLQKNNLLPQGASLHYVYKLNELLTHTLWWLWYSLVYLGLFALPFAAGYVLKHPFKRIKNTKLLILTSIPVIVALVIFKIKHVRLPYVMNIITEYGLGPMYNVINGQFKPMFHGWVWLLVTCAATGAGGWLIYIFLRAKKFHESPFGYIYTTGIVFLIPILLFHSFDRYYLALFVIVGIIIAKQLTFKNFYAPATLLVLTIYAVFSISQTQFYLNWNKARWEMASHALAVSQLQPHTIDGGYEWNGWHAYWSAWSARYEQGTLQGPWTAPWWIKYLFVNNTEDYIVSFSPLKPYSVIQTKQIPGWNPNNTLYLLKKP